MIDKPLYDNPLGGGFKTLQPGLGGPTERLTGPGRIDDQGQNPESIRRGRIEDMKINPGNYGLGLQQPRPGMGLGFPGMKSLEEGMLFLPDKDNPRSEEDIQAQYKQAQLEAARQRREGFLGQVVLPGEMKYEDFKATNLYGFKRNPNLPDSAYTDFDTTGVAGFDIPEAADPNNLLTGATPPTGGTLNGMPLFPETNIDDASMKGLPETNEPPMVATTNPYNRVGQQLMGPNQDEMLGTLKNIEQGIASLGLNYGQGNNMNQSSNYGDFSNFGIGSFFPPYGGLYG